MRSAKRRFGRSVLALCVGGLLFTPAAIASPAAVDQYTEAPPSGPGGSSTQLETPQNPPQQQESSQPAAPPPAPAPTETPAPAPEAVAPAPKPESKPAPKHREPHRRHEARPRLAANQTVTPASPVGDRDELPVTGYPLTRFILVALAVGLTALAVRAAMLVYGRMRGPARGAG